MAALTRVLGAAALLLGCGKGLSADPAQATGQQIPAPDVSADTDSVDPGTPASSTQPGDSPLPIGSAGCAIGAQCASQVCIPDVTGAQRCCEADCTLAGRVCDPLGACVCASQEAEARGECRRLNGKPCEHAEQCASLHCADGVCCNAACDGVCERCNSPGSPGACSLQERDPACPEARGFACFAPGRCRLPAALACSVDSDCDSEHCERTVEDASICCAGACDGVCQRCSANGACDDHPPADERCPEVRCEPATSCRAYRTPAPGECSAHGSCAGCEPLLARAGTPCGIARQCDGQGECRFTAVGKVAAGGTHTCALRDDGDVVCWGSNTLGQLGAVFDRTRVGADEDPAKVPDLTLHFERDVWQLTAGRDHTCALFDPGGPDAFRAASAASSAESNVRCWGANSPSEALIQTLLGTSRVVYATGTLVNPLATSNVELPSLALQISAGARHTCAVLATGQLACWGLNTAAQLGNGAYQTSAEPAQLPNLVALDRPAWQVRAGGEHTCALDALGRVTCWGAGVNGQLGFGDANDGPVPGEIVDVGGVVTQLALGFERTCALLAGGSVRCWGRNLEGELGYGHVRSLGDNETPAEAAHLEAAPGRPLGGDVALGGTDVVQITAQQGTQGFCALFASGRVRCWGENDRGQLGYGHQVDRATDYTPLELAGLPLRAGDPRYLGGDLAFGGPVQALAEGGRCALRVDGALYCFGLHTQGQLGLPGPPRYPDGSQTLTPEQLGSVNWVAE